MTKRESAIIEEIEAGAEAAADGHAEGMLDASNTLLGQEAETVAWCFSHIATRPSLVDAPARAIECFRLFHEIRCERLA